MAYCIKCGTENRPQAKYCRICGAQLALRSTSQSALETRQIKRPPSQPTVPVQDTTPEPVTELSQARAPAAPGPTLNQEFDQIERLTEDLTQNSDPLELPTTICERITLYQVIHRTSTLIQYAGVDWNRCWKCGAPGVTEETAFCKRCGITLEGRGAQCRVLSGEIPADLARGERLADRGRTFWIQPQHVATPGV